MQKGDFNLSLARMYTDSSDELSTLWRRYMNTGIDRKEAMLKAEDELFEEHPEYKDINVLPIDLRPRVNREKENRQIVLNLISSKSFEVMRVYGSNREVARVLNHDLLLMVQVLDAVLLVNNIDKVFYRGNDVIEIHVRSVSSSAEIDRRVESRSTQKEVAAASEPIAPEEVQKLRDYADEIRRLHPSISLEEAIETAVMAVFNKKG